MNLILESSPQMPFHTDMLTVAGALSPLFQQLDWLVTDYEVMGPSKAFVGGDPLLVSGAELVALLERERVQFVWGVFSGFAPDFRLDVKHLAVRPFADGNRALWDGSPAPQHPGALLEIVCFDASATLLITPDRVTPRLFSAAFPDARSLDDSNRKGAKSGSS